MNYFGYAAIMVLGVFIASVAQVLLKKSSQHEYASRIHEYINWCVIVGYGMMVVSTMCTVFAYRVIPISFGMVLDSTGYVFVAIFGFVFFHEYINKRRLFALSLIISGIVIYAFWG